MPAARSPEEHAAAVRAWWADRDARLRDPDGWLTLVGLHWLAPGENRFGSSVDNEIVLRGDAISAHAGSLWLEGDRVRLVPATPSVSHDGQPVTETVLEDDSAGTPTVVDLGSLRMHLIRRGERLGLRVRDRSSPALRQFQGVDHFPIDLGWRVIARFEPAAAGSTIEIADVTGQIAMEPTPGRVSFDRDGRTWSLDALPGEEDGSLWLIFADATNGAETYGGGRFLYSEVPQPDGSVVVDFNLAYNPPCVFSPYATCPLPPPQNRLTLRIDAGERHFHA
jgi:uncharacterized protein (DUF1684 family)